MIYGISCLPAQKVFFLAIMRYRSTRGSVRDISFEETLLKGNASDGGLFLPEDIPKISLDQLQRWSTYTYEELVYEISKLYIDESEISHFDLQDVIKKAYQNFPSSARITINSLKNGLKIAELYHGPTLAFKDLSMFCVAQLLQFFLKRRQQHATILVATSGDTGHSAIESMKGLDNLDVIVVYPIGRCTEIQELQMTTVLDNNIHCYAVEGTSDDEDVAMMSVLCDTEFSQSHNLGNVNSFNWGRIMIQIVHFIYIYFNCGVKKLGDPIQIIVPTGGAGNITAACIANMMGIPLTMVATVNKNDVLHRCLQEGVLSIEEDVHKTWASAMDIQVPYNFERLLYLYSGNDGHLTDTLMKKFHADKSMLIPRNILDKMKTVISSSMSSGNTQILETIQRCWNENNYVLCPHTATAVAYHYSSHASSHGESQSSQVCVATASPLKFPNAIRAAGIPHTSSKLLKELQKKKPKYEKLLKGQNWSEILRKKIKDISLKRASQATIMH